ncbi:hypothetical protein ABKN59_011221 [Abortiporus biennis]
MHHASWCMKKTLGPSRAIIGRTVIGCTPGLQKGEEREYSPVFHISPGLSVYTGFPYARMHDSHLLPIFDSCHMQDIGFTLTVLRTRL